MKCLAVGLGSMGKRRIRNLLQLKAGEVRGYDVRPDRREEAAGLYEIGTFETFEQALDWRPDLITISTPPDDHHRFAMAAARAGIPFFTELSINADGLEELAAAVEQQHVVAAPSCTPRFNPMIRYLRDIFGDGTIGQPTNMIGHVGQFLPDWHPWEDYRSFFAAQRRTGACRELLAVDLLWLPWILGDLKEISCMRARTGALDADIDDVYQVLMRFGGRTLGALQIDAVSRLPLRYYRFISSDGVVLWDWRSQFVQVYTASDGKWTEKSQSAGFAGFSIDQIYVDELKAFLDAIRGGKPYPYTLEEDLQRVRLLEIMERAADERRTMEVPES